jgi:hypothetical protein
VHTRFLLAMKCNAMLLIYIAKSTPTFWFVFLKFAPFEL